jgi:hypothetical protein
LGRQILKQPDGKLAVWSTNSDSIIIYDASEADIVTYFLERDVRDSIAATMKIIDELEAGEKPYYQFTMTYEEALRKHEERHGPLNRTEVRE